MRFDGWKKAYAVALVCAATAIGSNAQTFTTLASFDGTDGFGPDGALVQGRDGNFYGIVYEGGTNNSGAFFRITSSGGLTTLYSFDSANGFSPLGGLVQATDGNFYGTTFDGGANAFGTVFKITPQGELTTVYSFCQQMNCADGSGPYAGVIQGTDGNFYGTTLYGGVGNGTVFKLTPAGKLTILHSFCSSSCADGYGLSTGLIQSTDGKFYGTTTYGGVSGGNGTVFRITSGGKLTTLYSFCSQRNCPDGGEPTGVMQGTDGNFYGTTQVGGGGAYKGTVFQLTAAGKLTTLYSFCVQAGCPDGSNPNVGLVQGTDANFYGTTPTGGANNEGTVFRVTKKGMLTTLHSFDQTDGADPDGLLLQGTDGTFYGTTFYGGSNQGSYCGAQRCGTVFNVSVGLGPFVVTRFTSGKVGMAVIILGNNLTGATKVSFNGTAATFTVVSSSEIETTVPAGAETGSVEVTTPSGTLKSNVAFRVIPQIISFAPNSDPVGTPVTITGASLTQTTRVTFAGVKATTFTVDSDTQLKVTVPTGAKTGKIAVTTAGGTATSSGTFHVTP